MFFIVFIQRSVDIKINSDLFQISVEENVLLILKPEVTWFKFLNWSDHRKWVVMLSPSIGAQTC